MNIANKITCLRIVLMPVTLYLIFQPSWPLFLMGYILGTAIGFSDIIDGFIARRYGFVTRFGQFLDPLADKVFVVTTLLFFLRFGMVQGWLVILVMAREFAMTDLRTLASADKTDIRVNLLGKRKALFQYLLLFQLGYLRFVELAGIELSGFYYRLAHNTLALLVALVTFFTAFSMIYYVWLNRGLLSAASSTIRSSTISTGRDDTRSQ